MRISLKQLSYLVTLDETRHFGRAAERCGISQPSLSQQISNLETAIGLQLFGRGRGPVTPTVAGREVIAQARRILDDVGALQDLATSLQAGLGGTVRLGVSPTLGPYLLPLAVGRLHRDHPDLHLYIREQAPRALAEGLLRGDHDMILTQLPVQGSGLQAARLFREPLRLAVAADHPLAGRDAVTEADLAGLSVLSLGPGYMLHDQIVALCDRCGAAVQQDYEGTSLDALRAMTAMGMGVTLLPALYVASEIGGRLDDVVPLPFRGGRLMRSIGLVTRDGGGNRNAFHRLAEVLRATAAATSATGIVVEA